MLLRWIQVCGDKTGLCRFIGHALSDDRGGNLSASRRPGNGGHVRSRFTLFQSLICVRRGTAARGRSSVFSLLHAAKYASKSRLEIRIVPRFAPMRWHGSLRVSTKRYTNEALTLRSSATSRTVRRSEGRWQTGSFLWCWFIDRGLVGWTSISSSGIRRSRPSPWRNEAFTGVRWGLAPWTRGVLVRRKPFRAAPPADEIPFRSKEATTKARTAWRIDSVRVASVVTVLV